MPSTSAMHASSIATMPPGNQKQNQDNRTTELPRGATRELENATSSEPKYNRESERLSTFKNKWPVAFLTPRQMSSAGFYYTEREDIVKCAFCGVEVGGWVLGDVPMDDHKRWSPACRFIRQQVVGNVPLEDNTPEEAGPSGINNGYDTCGRYGITPVAKKAEFSIEKLGVQKIRAASFPNYMTLDSRLNTYKSWPISLKLKPKMLSEAGFFYTGSGDQTLCFHCGGGLKDWEENDDPWVEHARWFSKCIFVLHSKGKDFVDEVCGRKFMKQNSQLSASTGDLEKQPTCTSTMAENNAASTSVEQEPTKEQGKSAAGPSKEAVVINDARLCKICYENEMGVVFLPCGHLVACVTCAFSLTTCAVCRNPVTATLRTYFS